MVDNERLDDGRQADDDDDVHATRLECTPSSGFARTQAQTEQFGGVTDTAAACDVGRKVIDDKDGKSASALSDDTSDLLRHIVIDGSNIAMRLRISTMFRSCMWKISRPSSKHTLSQKNDTTQPSTGGGGSAGNLPKQYSCSITRF